MATTTSLKCSFQLADIAPRKGFTPATLMAATGLHRTTVQRCWFNNPRRIRFTTLARLCTVLDVAPRDLIALVPVDVPNLQEERR